MATAPGFEDPSPRGYVAAILVTVWGLRLSTYLTWRNWGRGEDWRYSQMRARSRGSFEVKSLFTVFWLQGVAAWGVGLPVATAVRTGQPDSLGWLDGVGAVVWAVGFGFEAIGDFQLAQFRPDPSNRGRVLDHGLWRYTRHPNYFGDATQWWGLGLIGLAAGAWWSLLGPARMTFVLLRMTGVFETERHLRESRGAAYEDYIRRTSVFLPRPLVHSPWFDPSCSVRTYSSPRADQVVGRTRSVRTTYLRKIAGFCEGSVPVSQIGSGSYATPSRILPGFPLGWAKAPNSLDRSWRARCVRTRAPSIVI